MVATFVAATHAHAWTNAVSNATRAATNSAKSAVTRAIRAAGAVRTVSTDARGGRIKSYPNLLMAV